MKQSLPADTAWLDILQFITSYGEEARPRDKKTLEILHHNFYTVDLRSPVIRNPLRKLNYKFMAAEALWILSGDNKLEPLTKHVPKMADFSDDGVTLAGAYGPKIMPQMSYVLGTLLKDLDSRQAVLTIWEREPGPSKDIPCTVAMTFSVRKRKLHSHVYMRSSDAWLGIPYDTFSFSMVAYWLLMQLNWNLKGNGDPPIELGNLTITMTSSHLYTENLSSVEEVLNGPDPELAAVTGLEEALANGRTHVLVDELRKMERGEPCVFKSSS